MDPLLEPLRRLVAISSSYEELIAGLDRLRSGEAGSAIAERLAVLGMKARGLGYAGKGR